jgi:glycosyltransferase involved in cell wall biosynthesis
MIERSIGSRTIERHNMTSNRAAHVVLIPSYNTGARLFDTIAGVRARGLPVIVVIDGSTDGTGETLIRVAEREPDLFACALPMNLGKGAAVLHGLRLARAMGFTHALTMDADGQHSADHISEMIALSLAHPEMMVLGQPLFDASAPRIRILGHKVANFCTGLVTRSGSIRDSLFGFRIYPIPPLIEVFESTSGMRQFDFDSEAVIRLYWNGIRPINVVTPVRYFRRDEGGVSHFRYLRDNILLAAMYLRLLAARLAGPGFFRAQASRAVTGAPASMTTAARPRRIVSDPH